MWELDHIKGWVPKNWCFQTGAGEDSWEFLGQKGDQTSQSWRKSTLNIHWKDDGDAPVLWPTDAKVWRIGKDPDAGKDWGQEEKGATEDEMVGWHHWLNGYVSEHVPGDSEGQECSSPWDCKESDTTEQLNNDNNILRLWRFGELRGIKQGKIWRFHFCVWIGLGVKTFEEI